MCNDVRAGRDRRLHPPFAADVGFAGIGLSGSSVKPEPLEVVMAAKAAGLRAEWS
jgi:hypothetical protein